MVRVSGLQQQVAAEMTDVSPDGMTSAEQLTHLRARVGPMLRDASALFQDETPASKLRRGPGLRSADYADLSRAQQKGPAGVLRAGRLPRPDPASH